MSDVARLQAPQEASSYTSELLQPLQGLLQTQASFYAQHPALKAHLLITLSHALDGAIVTCFQGVLDSVATLETSIQRIRKSKKKQTSSETMSDQDKIRHQLKLDLQAIVTLVCCHGERK
jgi:hypothetical protein